MLRLRAAVVGAQTFCVLCGEGSALKHLRETFIAVDMVGVFEEGCCRSQDGLSPLGLVMRAEQPAAAKAGISRAELESVTDAFLFGVDI